MATGPSDGCSSSVGVLSSQMSLVCTNLTETKPKDSETQLCATALYSCRFSIYYGVNQP